MPRSSRMALILIAITGIMLFQGRHAAHASSMTPHDACGGWVTEGQATDASNPNVHITTTLQVKANCDVWQVATSVWESTNAPYGSLTATNFLFTASDSQGDWPGQDAGNTSRTITKGQFLVFYSGEPSGPCAWGGSYATVGTTKVAQAEVPPQGLWICSWS